MDWSPYQRDIFGWVERGSGNAIVTAVAGSGKTTTLVEAANKAKGAGIFLAFNRSVADELRRRLPSQFDARTLNSLGHRLLMMNLKGVRPRLDPHKTFALMKRHMVGVGFEPTLAKTVSLCKAHGLSPTNFPYPITSDAVRDIIDTYQIDIGESEDNFSTVFRAVQDILDLSLKETSVIDYDDQLWMPVILHMKHPSRGWVMVDEAQDLSAIQLHLLRCIKAERMIAVGDPGQAIYGFRGAGTRSMSLIEEQFSCKSLPLTITYRCPVSVVAEALRWHSGIEAAPGAPMGEVVEIPDVTDASRYISSIEGQTMVVSRKVAPLVGVAQDLWAAGRKCWLDARDHCTKVLELAGKADDDAPVRQVLLLAEERLTKATKDAKRLQNESIRVDAEDLARTCHILAGGVKTVKGLEDRALSLFTRNESAKIRLTSVHRAKGGEAEQVVWLEPPEDPEEVHGQERNICYVAATRAKRRLVKLSRASDTGGTAAEDAHD